VEGNVREDAAHGRAEREAGSAAGQEQQVAGDDASEENQGD
jgi:hypothetical protein